MKLRYKLALAGAGVATIVAILGACGGSTSSFSITSTCDDWTNASTSLKDSYVQGDATTDNVTVDSFVSQVDNLCGNNPTISLTGVLDSVSITDAG